MLKLIDYNKIDLKQELSLPEVQENLAVLIPSFVSNVIISKNETVIYTSSNNLYNLMFFIRFHTNTQYTIVSDSTAVDYPESNQRFEVIYNMLSLHYNNRIRVKTLISGATPLTSLTSIFQGLGWMERETWDMFGICYMNHPDLRRILTDYGFDGFPLSKNFPLSGYMEVRYDDEKKRVVYEPIEISQEFRNFDLISPWISRSFESD